MWDPTSSSQICSSTIISIDLQHTASLHSCILALFVHVFVAQHARIHSAPSLASLSDTSLIASQARNPWLPRLRVPSR